MKNIDMRSAIPNVKSSHFNFPLFPRGVVFTLFCTFNCDARIDACIFKRMWRGGKSSIKLTQDVETGLSINLTSRVT